MCELLGMSSKVPTTVTCGRDQLARHSLAGPHREGWGVAYYDDTSGPAAPRRIPMIACGVVSLSRAISISL